MEKRAESLQANNYSVLGMRVFRRTDTDVVTFSKEEGGVYSCAFWQMESTKNVDHFRGFRNKMGPFSKGLHSEFFEEIKVVKEAKKMLLANLSIIDKKVLILVLFKN